MQIAQEYPTIDLQPAMTLDCRGMQCPAPILELSKAARTYGKKATVLEIIVDDAEFPSDLRAWCRASKNTLLSLMEDEGLFVAHVGLNLRAEERSPASGPRTMAQGAKALPLMMPNGEVAPTSAPSPASGAATSDNQTHVIDCRGMQCPGPILAVAKKAQQLGRQPGLLDIMATDEQFPTDLRAWCRASKAELVHLDQFQGQIRAFVAIGNVPQEVIKRALPAPVEEVSMPLVNVKVAPAAIAAKGQIEMATKPTIPDLPKPPPALPPTAAELMRMAVEGAAPGIVNTKPAPAAKAPVPATSAVATPKSAPAIPPIPAPAPSSVEALGPLAPTLQAFAAVAPANDVAQQLVPRENRCTIMVLKNEFESLTAAMLCATTAAAKGMETSIFFSFWGVNVLRADKPQVRVEEENLGFLQKVLQSMTPEGRSQKGGSVLQRFMGRSAASEVEQLIAIASEQKIKFIVCAMSLGIMGLQKRDIVDLPNVEFAGVDTFMDLSRRSASTMVF